MSEYQHFFQLLRKNKAQPFIDFVVRGTEEASRGFPDPRVDTFSLLSVLANRDEFLKEMLRKYINEALKKEGRYLSVISFPLSASEEQALVEFVKPRMQKYVSLKC